jgi:F0F1-type ATP synthase assembly protein I
MPNPLESGLSSGAFGREAAPRRSDLLGTLDLRGARVSTEGPERADQRQQSLQWRVAGLGLEFGAGIAGCVLFGYWVDRTFGTGSKGVISGAIVGCVGGMYHLITRAIRLQRAAELERRRPRSLQDGPGRDETPPGPDV